MCSAKRRPSSKAQKPLNAAARKHNKCHPLFDVFSAHESGRNPSPIIWKSFFCRRKSTLLQDFHSFHKNFHSLWKLWKCQKRAICSLHNICQAIFYGEFHDFVPFQKRARPMGIAHWTGRLLKKEEGGFRGGPFCSADRFSALPSTSQKAVCAYQSGAVEHPLRRGGTAQMRIGCGTTKAGRPCHNASDSPSPDSRI